MNSGKISIFYFIHYVSITNVLDPRPHLSFEPRHDQYQTDFQVLVDFKMEVSNLDPTKLLIDPEEGIEIERSSAKLKENRIVEYSAKFQTPGEYKFQMSGGGAIGKISGNPTKDSNEVTIEYRKF